MQRHPRAVVRTLTAATLVLLLDALVTTGQPRFTRPSLGAADDRRAVFPPLRVTLDGVFDEWPAAAVTLADGRFLYLRVPVGRPMSLQGSDRRLVIRLDVDGNASTGHRAPPDLGVDLHIEYSPRPDGHGIAVHVLNDRDTPTRIAARSLGLMHGPTHAASRFEVRIPRRFEGVEGLPRAGLASAGRIAGTFSVIEDGANPATGMTAFEQLMPPVDEDVRPRGDLPTRTPDAVRIVSYDVEHRAPMADGGPVERVIAALDPDVILLQQWRATSSAKVTLWFNKRLGKVARWYASPLSAHGDVIVSRHPLEFRGRGPAQAFVHCVVRRFGAKIGVVSLQLPCCGTYDSLEDHRRRARATAINQAIASDPGTILVIGGNLNLVGDRRPLQILCRGLATDGSDLTVARPLITGDSAVYTWRDREAAFTPVWIHHTAYSGDTADLRRAFVLDTSKLSDDALAASGLERQDTSVVRSLPVVLDIVPR